MPHRSRADYVAMGKQAILTILEQQGAATIRELEARASDRACEGLPTKIDPHHLTEARRALESPGGPVFSITQATRGAGEPITTYHLEIRRGNATLIQRAAARKRLLTARFQGWARGTGRYPRGLIGPAGEAALTAALIAVADAGYVPAGDRYGETAKLLGDPVQGGSLDNAAFLTIADPVTGHPTAYTVPFEVKNIREWIYGRSAELHQLLYKSALLQRDNPDARIVPVLVCRRRQETARRLGITIGFYSIQYRTQLLSPAPDIPIEHVRQVQQELGYEDVRRTSDPPAVLLKALRESVRRDAARTASRWAECGPALLRHFERLRRTTLASHERAEAWSNLLSAIRDDLGLNYEDER